MNKLFNNNNIILYIILLYRLIKILSQKYSSILVPAMNPKYMATIGIAKQIQTKKEAMTLLTPSIQRLPTEMSILVTFTFCTLSFYCRIL